MFKTCWDVLVLLGTIYVAIVVPYNACFTEPFQQQVGCYYSNHSNTSISESDQDHNDNDEDQRKRSIVVDVIVETIFIIGNFFF